MVLGVLVDYSERLRRLRVRRVWSLCTYRGSNGGWLWPIYSDSSFDIMEIYVEVRTKSGPILPPPKEASVMTISVADAARPLYVELLHLTINAPFCEEYYKYYAITTNNLYEYRLCREDINLAPPKSLFTIVPTQLSVLI